MDKNHLINIKTLENFRADNSKYYPIVLNHLKEILNTIQSKVQAGKWTIEGTITAYDGGAVSQDNAEISFTDKKSGEDIYINYSTEVVNNDTSDSITGPSGETATTIYIDQVVFYENFGNHEYDIVMTPELDKVIQDIFIKLAHTK